MSETQRKGEHLKKNSSLISFIYFHTLRFHSKLLKAFETLHCFKNREELFKGEKGTNGRT